MKAPDAFRTISEVAEDLDLPQHVLRFWETRFTQIKPMKRGGGRRYYRPEDVDLLRGIRLLLYTEGFTIRGVQRLLKEKGIGFVAAVGQTGSVQTVSAVERDGVAQRSKRESAPRQPEAEPQASTEGLSEDQPAEASGEAPLAQNAVLPVPVAALSRDGRRTIEAALGELAEAKRLLDQVR
jgi:DNA-binding transcriptional MerR regulator